MAGTNLYVAQTVGVVEDRWYQDRYDDSPLVQSRKRYHLHQTLFAATDAESAYQWIKDLVDNDSDCNHDGEGDKTFFYSLGIHEIELLSCSLEELSGCVESSGYGLTLGTFTTANVDDNGVPAIRAKHDLQIFRHPLWRS